MSKAPLYHATYSALFVAVFAATHLWLWMGFWCVLFGAWLALAIVEFQDRNDHA